MAAHRIVVMCICAIIGTGCADVIEPIDRAAWQDAGAPLVDEVMLGSRYVAQRGCPVCHDSGDGILAGQTALRPGSSSYGANLTPDEDTGLGDWSDDSIARAIRTGVDNQMQPLCPAMPRFAAIGEPEMTAIIAFLRSLPPTPRQTPESVCPPLKNGNGGQGPGDMNGSTGGGPTDGGGDPPLPPDLQLLVADLASPADLIVTHQEDLATSPDLGLVPPDCAIVINEVQTAGAGGASDEFVELYNPCRATIDLTDQRLVYRSALGVKDVTLLKFAGGRMPPGTFHVIGGAGFSGVAAETYFGALAAAGGGLALRDAMGGALDTVGWGTAQNGFERGVAAVAPPAMKSIARRPDGRQSGDNGRDFAVAISTPGAPNR